MKQVHEQEKASLNAACDTAQISLVKLERELKDTNKRYETLASDFRDLQIRSGGDISNLTTEVKLKDFKIEHLQLLYNESQSLLHNCNLTNEKLQKKIDVMSKEYYTLKSDTDVKINSLELQQNEQQANLSSYEKLEKELDDVVTEAAESGDPDHVLLAYGYGATVPTNAKRRLKQSISLARQLLTAQKSIHRLENEIKKVNRNYAKINIVQAEFFSE